MTSASKLLTTGKAAELLGVTPDTVLRWIKRGRLEARRTSGGHNRILLEDIEPLLKAPPGEEDHADSSTCTLGAAHCWEYLNPHGDIRSECKRCIVYRSRASWCFQLAGLKDGAGHSGVYCETTCEECGYYRRVNNLPTKVLVISSDQELIGRLENEPQRGVSFQFARNLYQASTIVGSFLPGIVLLDCEIGQAQSSELVECIAADTRVPGLRIVLAVRPGVQGPQVSARDGDLLAGVLEKPFDSRCIEALLDCLPAVEVVDPSDEALAESESEVQA